MPSEAREETGCPGLVSSAQWDEPEALRGELHTAARLSEHAIELAHAHGAPSLRVPPGPLRKRFADARRRIDEAYEVLSRALRTSREPSPAEEWLLDNSHVVEEQIREVEEDLPWGYLVELPRLASGAMRGYPRVYGLCLDYLRHTDARVELQTLSDFVIAYQTVHPLTIGELWAVPIMLRVGLVLAVGALASSEASESERERGSAWAARIIEHGQAPEQISEVLAELERNDRPITAPLLVELLRHLREHEAPLGIATDWVVAQAAKMGTTPEDLTRRQHLRRAADQVSVGNSITSMRAIAALDWNAFFERASRVEAILRRDPVRAYAAMDIATRDQYRHAVERLARRSKKSEIDVADTALTLAEVAKDHIGFWLIGDRRIELEKSLGYRARFDELIAQPIVRHPSTFYLGTIVFFAGVACGLAALVGRERLPPVPLALLIALFSLPATEIAIAIVNSLVVAVVPPRVLPKMALESSIPPEHRTLVVVPAILDGPETVRDLLESLEIRSLANLEKNLHFALLTDFRDDESERRPEDEALLALARDGIAELDARWEHPGEHRYVLLHRRRVRNESHDRWMGWERKRGKLEELNRLLRGATDTTFDVVTAPKELLESVRFVITLDADTELPRDTARKLVATLAHPLVRPRLDRAGRRVVSGHGVIQPRVGTAPVSSRRTRYARVASPPTGIDPYTTAVSDVYQDLFGEGSFVGKGIYDVDAFAATLGGRVPENALLSHDLFEGIFARSALASDIEVLDEQPSSYEVAAARLHRWIRGDWQMVVVALRFARELRALDAWKIADNLRRSVLPLALVVSCVVGWLEGPLVGAFVTATLVVTLATSVVARTVIAMSRARTSRTFVGAIGDDLASNLRQSLVHGIFLFDEALLAVDAIARTIHRLAISHANLLEWTTMGQAERLGGRGVHPRLMGSAALACVILAAVAVVAPLSLPLAAPVLALWISAPAVAAYLRRPEKRAPPELLPAERKELRVLARRTWRFFETFVTEGDHHLPPDNFQEDPRGVVAHRTSPTNIGLYLLSVVSAHDFGFITVGELVDRLDKTLATIEKLERREGHILNWYDTQTLAPLEPQYVSTVDSGNFAAYLWTLREACEELVFAPIVNRTLFDGADDALALAADAGANDLVRALRATLSGARKRMTGTLADVSCLREAEQALARGAADSEGLPEVARHWLERAATLFRAALAEVERIDASRDGVPRARTLSDAAAVDDAAAELVRSLRHDRRARRRHRRRHELSFPLRRRA